MKINLTALILFVSFVAFAPASVQAQAADRENARPATDLPATATGLTRDMVTRLRLNEGQYLQLLPVNRKWLANVNGINRQYKNDDVTRTAKLVELRNQYEQECSRILSSTQVSQLQPEQPADTATTENGVG